MTCSLPPEAIVIRDWVFHCWADVWSFQQLTALQNAGDDQPAQSRPRPCLTSLWICTRSSLYCVQTVQKSKLCDKWIKHNKAHCLLQDAWVASGKTKNTQKMTLGCCSNIKVMTNSLQMPPTKIPNTINTPHSHTASECWSKLLICRCIRRHVTSAKHLQNSHGCPILRTPDPSCSRFVATATPLEVSMIAVLQITF